MEVVAKENKRDYLLDTFRGLLLVIMALDHTELSFVEYSYQTFGAFSATEGFFYLSGLVFGMVYFKYLNTPGELFGKALNRIKVMYKYHIIIFSLLLIEHLVLRYTVGMEISAFYTRWEGNFPDLLLRFSTFSIYPYISHVIPIYIFFFLIGPVLLISYQRNLAWLTIGVSSLIWMASYFMTNPFFYVDFLNDKFLSEGMRCFNPLSWQILFVAGTYFGYLRAIKFKLVFNNYLAGIAVAYCLLFFVFKLVPYFHQFSFYESNFGFIGRQLLAPLRLLNFMFFVYLVAYLFQGKKLMRRNFFAFIGSFSLYVFIFHILLSYNILKLKGAFYGLPTIVQYIAAFFLVWSLTIPAFIKENHKNKRGLFEGWNEYLMLFPKEIVVACRLLFKWIGRLKFRKLAQS